ncbi:MAG: phosphoglucomutase/phosphomannomutase family protein [Ignavibacteria bacterium]|jgi:phosphomannomutase|nr:phosphoglucomutase/phosphomannomutase family protein [Ignavibacteria bacterium]
MEPVKFGTDGWRAVIGDTYTFENVRRVSLASARVFKNHPNAKNGIVIGYDTRFLSKEFAHASAEIFASEGYKVYITDSFVTTPTISLLSRDMNLAFGVIITASHNPFKYNGFKLKDSFGGSMSPDELVKVEAELRNIEFTDGYKSFEELQKSDKIEYIDGKKYYIENLKRKIDIDLISKSGLKVLYEAMYGAGQNMIDTLIKVDQLHNTVNPYFEGGAPEPVEKNLALACKTVKEGKYNLCIVTDGDADRIAIIDDNGDFLDAQKTFALLLKYLHKTKGLNGIVVRGFSASELIREYCEKYNLKLETVPVGFKYISKRMIEDDVLIGAEESGGIGIKGHLPERDGLFNGLLYLEMIARTGKSLSELKEELDDEFGKYYYKRIDVHTTEEKKNATLEACRITGPGDSIGGKKILNIDPLDGYKFFFENGWITVRASGTEPLLRFYCETKGNDETLEILNKVISKFNL